ncbi:MAG: hypothetical protein RLZ55_583 [Actinomycetota bacterium]
MSSSTRTSAIVLVTGSGRQSAMPLIVRRRILPELALASAGTTTTDSSGASACIERGTDAMICSHPRS